MQSRYIADSALMAYPPSSLPDPKFGRLNGYGKFISSVRIYYYVDGHKLRIHIDVQLGVLRVVRFLMFSNTVIRCIFLPDAWCSSDHNPGYVRLEIGLPQLALISRIAVQGGHQIKRKTNRYWVTQ